MRTASYLWGVAVLVSGGIWLVAAAPADQVATMLALVRDLWPLGEHIGANAVRSLAAVALAGILLLVCDAAGVRILRWLSADARPSGAARMSAVLVAYALLSTALLGMSAAGLWYPSLLVAGFGLGAAFAGREIPRSISEWRRGVVSAWGSTSPAGRCAVAVLGAALALLLAPPELEIDSLSYHLAFPEQILAAHRLFGTDVYSHWAIPLVIEFPFVFPVMFGLDAAARIVALALTVAGALALVKSLRSRLSFSNELALVGLALLLPASRYVLATAKNDAPACGYALAAVGLLIESGVFARSIRRPAAIFTAALLGGVLVAVKYVALPIVAAVGFASLLRIRHRDRPMATAAMMFGVALPLLPWAVKSYLYLSDPLYPMGLVVLPGIFGDPATNAHTRKLFAIYIMETRPLAGFPREMITLAGRNAFLLFAAVPALVRWRPPWLVPLLGATALGFGAVVVGMRGGIDTVERFSFPVFVFWNIVAGFAMARDFAAGSAGFLVRVAMGGLAIIGFGRIVAVEWWPGGTWQKHKRPGAFIAGTLSYDEFRRQGMFSYGAILPDIVAAVAAGARTGKVLAVGENKFLGIKRRVLTQVFEPPFVWRAVAGSGSVERVAVKFRQRNIRWLLYNVSLAGWGRFSYSPYEWTPRMIRLYVEYARRHLRIMASSGRVDPAYGGAWLYDVLPFPGDTPARRIAFLPGAERFLAYASLAGVHGAYGSAAERFAAVLEVSPEVAWVRSLYADALLKAGRVREAYVHAAAAAGTVGLLDERNLITWAVSAGKSGDAVGARNALARARAAYPLAPARVAAAGVAAAIPVSH